MMIEAMMTAEQRAEVLRVTVEFVEAVLTCDRQGFRREDGTWKSLRELTPQQVLCIAGVEITTRAGEGSRVSDYEFYTQREANELLHGLVQYVGS